MKVKTISLAMILSLVSINSYAKEFVLIDNENAISKGDWALTHQDLGIKNSAFKIQNNVLKGGKQDGSQVITISSGNFTIKVSPTRGMGILSVEGDGVRMGWDSPVDEVVNPSNITLESRGGLGWLDGFNEMMVRCGFEWTGQDIPLRLMA